MHRDADGTSLVSNSAGHGLTNPPGGIGAEFEALVMVKFVHCPGKTDVALLNQVKEGQASPDMFLGDADHQTQVGFNQMPLGFRSLGFNTSKVGLEQVTISLDRIYKSGIFG